MKAVNIKDGCDIYGGRGSNTHMNNTNYPDKGWLGNPYPISLGRERCIELFRKDFYKKIALDEKFRQAVLGLIGKKVGCFCKPLQCHLDVVQEWLEEIQEIDYNTQFKKSLPPGMYYPGE